MAGTLPARIMAGSVPENMGCRGGGVPDKVMDKKIKYFSILSIIMAVVAIGSVLLFSDEIMAGASDNIRGWIWAANIGWISFNSVNCDSDGNGITDNANYSQCPVGNTSVDYGVNASPSTGNFFGYGWSENIGWINFAPAGPYPSAPNYSVCIDWPGSGQNCEGAGDDDYYVSGWARAVSPVGQPATATGGWDGWIKLGGGGSSYGVWLNPLSREFEGWAWGSDDSSEEAVIGWIRINGIGDGSDDDFNPYIPPASFPVTALNLLSAQGNYCHPSGGSMAYPPITLNWTFSGGVGDTQSAYQVQIDNNSGCSSPEITTAVISTTGTPGPNYSLYIDPLVYGPLSFNANYYWCIKVWGSFGSVSDWVNSPTYFSTASHRWPNASFTANPTNTLPDREVVFTNNSTCYSIDGGPVACGSYLWNFGDSSTSTLANPVPHSYAVKGVYPVQLNATDGLGACSASAFITVRLPLPFWKEVPPTF